jgi:hypothetical protein
MAARDYDEERIPTGYRGITMPKRVAQQVENELIDNSGVRAYIESVIDTYRNPLPEEDNA